MDQQRKTIQTLTAALDEKRDELTSLYRQFGGKLLADSSSADIVAAPLPPARVDAWRSLMSARESDTQSILDIKDAVNRQKELQQFRKELERTIDEQKAAYRQSLEALGLELYRQYTEADEPAFGASHRGATEEYGVLNSLVSRQEDIREKLGDSGFFSKIFLQFKQAGLASKIRQSRLRAVRILATGAETLIKDAGFSVSEGSHENSQGLQSLIAAARANLARLDDIRSRSTTVDQDVAAVNTVLQSLAAADNPARRMDELRGRIRDNDKRIDSLTIMSAREYSDKFLDDEGSSLLGDTRDGHTFSDMGAYSHQLERVAAYRAEIATIRRKVDVLETSLKIEAIDRNVVSYQRTIEDYERKIQRFQELNANLRVSIEEAGAEKARLVAHREEVEKALSADT